MPSSNKLYLQVQCPSLPPLALNRVTSCILNQGRAARLPRPELYSIITRYSYFAIMMIITSNNYHYHRIAIVIIIDIVGVGCSCN